MAFCINCGAKLPENHRFCTECGAAQPAAFAAQSAPEAQPAPSAEKTTYVSANSSAPMEKTTFIPKQESYTPPQESYIPPQQSYTPPQQSYTPPQQSYTPPQESYMPPQQSYTMPQSTQAKPGITLGAGKKTSGKSKVGLIVVIVLILAILGGAAFFFLTGKDGADAPADVDESILGVYEAISYVRNGKERDVEDEWLELKANGKGQLMLDGEKYSFRWELDDEDLTIVQQGDEFTGTLIDGIIELDINDMLYTYVHEDLDYDRNQEEEEDEEDEDIPEETMAAVEPEAPAVPETEAAPLGPSDLEYWERDWYGWWIITTVYEGDPELENDWWDSCATLSIDPDGSGTLVIWDEDTSKTDPLAGATMELSIVDGDVMAFNSVEGFIAGSDVGYYEWNGRTDDDVYPDLLWFGGQYDDGDGLCFDYTFYMRPWGMSWQDIEIDDPGLLPYYYEDWYLPLIESGVEKAPSTIG